jgi:hypothetical protein
MPDAHNVFISHRHEDDALVGDLKSLLVELPRSCGHVVLTDQAARSAA